MEDRLPELKYYGPGSSVGASIDNSLDRDPKEIWVQTSGSDRDSITLCNQSRSDHVYCIRTDAGGIRVRKADNNLYWAREVRFDGKSPGDVLALILANPVDAASDNFGWHGKDGGAITAEYVTPTVRLTCDVISGGTAQDNEKCPAANNAQSQTPLNTAYFEWVVSEGPARAAGADALTCSLDGTNYDDCDIPGAELRDIKDDYSGKIRFDLRDILCTGSDSRSQCSDKVTGEHQFTITVRNGAGKSSTTYRWVVVPDLPLVEIVSTDPGASGFQTCDNASAEGGNSSCEDNSVRETTQRSIILQWTARVNLSANPQSDLEEVYCKVSLANFAGNTNSLTAAAPYTDNATCPKATAAPVTSVYSGPDDGFARSGDEIQVWSGTLSLPQALNNTSPLPFHNTIPHEFAVTAVNKGGASNTDRFRWRIVDHSPPVNPLNPLGDTCYSPYNLGGNYGTSAVGAQGRTFVIPASGDDPQSGLYSITWPGIGTNYIGSGGLYTTPRTFLSPVNNVSYQSNVHGQAGMYTFGTGSQALSATAPGTFYVRISSNVPPNYPYIDVPFRLVPDTEPPIMLASDFTGGTTDAAAPGGSGWTSGNVTFALSHSSGPAGCGQFEKYQYRVAANGGAYSSPVDLLSPSLTITSEGYRAIQVRAVDNLNNASAWSNPRYAKIDRTAPPAVGHSGTNSSAWRNTNWTATRGTVNDANHPYSSGIVNYQYCIDYTVSSPGTCDTLADVPGSGSVTISSEGSRWLAFRAIDQMGYAGAWGSFNQALIDKTDPVITGGPSVQASDIINSNWSDVGFGPSVLGTNVSWQWSGSDVNPGVNAISGIDYYSRCASTIRGQTWNPGTPWDLGDSEGRPSCTPSGEFSGTTFAPNYGAHNYHVGACVRPRDNAGNPGGADCGRANTGFAADASRFHMETSGAILGNFGTNPITFVNNGSFPVSSSDQPQSFAAAYWRGGTNGGQVTNVSFTGGSSLRLGPNTSAWADIAGADSHQSCQFSGWFRPGGDSGNVVKGVVRTPVPVDDSFLDYIMNDFTVDNDDTNKWRRLTGSTSVLGPGNRRILVTNITDGNIWIDNLFGRCDP
jgi:hypothetical protein